MLTGVIHRLKKEVIHTIHKLLHRVSVEKPLETVDFWGFFGVSMWIRASCPQAVQEIEAFLHTLLKNPQVYKTLFTAKKAVKFSSIHRLTPVPI